MDIVDQMAADIAMKMNGGEWTDGKWYSQGHRDAWVKAVQPYADEIERLRLLVHYAFCEGQITPFILEDWINSRSYAALKEGK